MSHRAIERLRRERQGEILRAINGDDSDEDEDSSCNEAIKGIFVLNTYSLLLMCVIVYFYDISNIDTSDDFMYFVMYIFAKVVLLQSN